MRLNNITAEKWEFLIERTEKLPQGIYLWYKEVPYPRRVYYDIKNPINHILRVLEALGVVKKFMFALVHLKDIVVPRTLNVKKYELFLRKLYVQFEWILAEFYIQDDEYSVPVWEIGKFIEKFLLNLGFSEDIAKNYSKIVMMILEFDNAYRYPLQDLAGETTKELLQNLRKEILRLFKIYSERESLEGRAEKVNPVANMLSYIFVVPKIKNAFLDALKEIDLEKIKLDINDTYHTSFWRGYNYGGKSFEERYQFFLDTHKGKFPTYRKRENPEATANFLLGL